MNASPSPRLLSIAEAAQRLRLSRWTLYDAIRRGKLSPTRVGGRLYLTPAMIDTFRPGGAKTPPSELVRLGAAVRIKQIASEIIALQAEAQELGNLIRGRA